MSKSARCRRTRARQPLQSHPRFETLESRLVLSSNVASTGFTASLEVPATLGRHVGAFIWVDYSNQGSTPINAPIVTLHGSDNSLLSLYPAGPEKINYGNPPQQYSDTVSFLASGSSATPTVLQPGESMRVPIYYVGQKEPWNFGSPSVQFDLTSADQTSTTPLNLSQFVADFRAEGYSAAQAQQYANATKQILGNTVGGLVAYADANGTTPTSLQDLIDAAEVAAAYQVFDPSGSVAIAAPVTVTSPADNPPYPGGPIQNIDTFPPPNGATPDQYIFLVKGYHDGAPDNTDAQNIVKYNADHGRNVEVLTVDWSDASGAGRSAANPSNYTQAAKNALAVGDEIARYMKDHGISPEQTTIAGHSLGAQAAGEAGQRIQTLFPKQKLAVILAADAAGPGFSGKDPSRRLDSTDGRKVVDIHTTQSFGDANQIGTIDQYVQNASNNPVTAHSQAWDLLMKSMTDSTMKTNDGQGFGANANTPGVQKFGNQGPIHFLLGGASNLAVRTAVHATLLGASKGQQPVAVGVSRSADPNDLTGPSGKVSVGSPLDYQINFENAPSATAPAQEVVINEHLDSHLNLSTFQLTDIRFGSTVLSIPLGAQSVNSTVQITENGKPLNVQVSAGLDAQHHNLRIEFDSLDPSTGLPPDVMTGFLPPEDGSGRGLADVAYSVQLNSKVHAGTHIHSSASISFDGAPAHRTNTVTETVA